MHSDVLQFKRIKSTKICLAVLVYAVPTEPELILQGDTQFWGTLVFTLRWKRKMKIDGYIF